MNAADLAALVPLVERLIEAITNRGDDPLVEIPRITRSLEVTERAEARADDYMDQKFSPTDD